tara:strand:- start:178 stop:366 length:189 start_codon:yes stop_codon:yes gene_type:complete
MFKLLLEKAKNLLEAANETQKKLRAWVNSQSLAVKLVLVGLLVLAILGSAKVCLGVSVLSLP